MSWNLQGCKMPAYLGVLRFLTIASSLYLPKRCGQDCTSWVWIPVRCLKSFWIDTYWPISDWVEFSWPLCSQGRRKPKTYTIQLWEACNQLLVPHIAVIADWSNQSVSPKITNNQAHAIPMITNHLKSKRMKDTVVSVLFRSSSGFEPQEVESVSTCLQSMERKPHAYLLSSSRNNTGNIHQKILGHDYWLGLCQERIQSLEHDRPPMPYVALLIAT